jgi:hypothetical protein
MQRKTVKLAAAVSRASPRDPGAATRGAPHYDARGTHLVPRGHPLARPQTKRR